MLERYKVVYGSYTYVYIKLADKLVRTGSSNVDARWGTAHPVNVRASPTEQREQSTPGPQRTAFVSEMLFYPGRADFVVHLG
jgi:hypothetical protein